MGDSSEKAPSLFGLLLSKNDLHFGYCSEDPRWGYCSEKWIHVAAGRLPETQERQGEAGGGGSSLSAAGRHNTVIGPEGREGLCCCRVAAGRSSFSSLTRRAALGMHKDSNSNAGQKRGCRRGRFLGPPAVKQAPERGAGAFLPKALQHSQARGAGPVLPERGNV